MRTALGLFRGEGVAARSCGRFPKQPVVPIHAAPFGEIADRSHVAERRFQLTRFPPGNHALADADFSAKLGLGEREYVASDVGYRIHGCEYMRMGISFQ